MERRYKDQLNLRFDEVVDRGFSSISNSELLRWFSRKRITASVWAELNDRWEEREVTHEDEAVPLKIAEWGGGYVIAWGVEGWMAPVAEWAGDAG